MQWTKAKASGDGACVEVAPLPDGGVAVKDSKQGHDGPILAYTSREFAAFLDGAKKGEFDHLI